MPRYHLKYLLDGQTKVGCVSSTLCPLYALFLIGLGLYDPIKKIVDPLCLSCFQVLQDSPFLKDLNEGGHTVPGVEYHYVVSNQMFSPLAFNSIRAFFDRSLNQNFKCLGSVL
ncbi:hypothetical protein KI688_008799 [Linnemannia hyalina]|uniref:Uncharacterized protein n=1 Tax=Linnemannia hyalina TaxID=64524 RepID=A0A9P7Y2V1_9FUNG|nr:hypothetical protein KI688_008799 [Linnemannia hyalina]